jgi:hypothetical protein
MKMGDISEYQELTNLKALTEDTNCAMWHDTCTDILLGHHDYLIINFI